jgi:hypothetical protein
VRLQLLGASLLLLCTQTESAQTTIPLTPERWTATDSLRFTTYLGRP